MDTDSTKLIFAVTAKGRKHNHDNSYKNNGGDVYIHSGVYDRICSNSVLIQSGALVILHSVSSGVCKYVRRGRLL